MRMVFENIPDLFVQAYRSRFAHWAANPDKVGTVARFMFDQPLEPIPFSSDQRRILGVRLRADLDTSRRQDPRIVVRPQTEEDEEAINRFTFEFRLRLSRAH